jgi:hypothetical protein
VGSGGDGIEEKGKKVEAWRWKDLSEDADTFNGDGFLEKGGTPGME